MQKVDEIQYIYEHSFPRLTERFFHDVPWPSVEVRVYVYGPMRLRAVRAVVCEREKSFIQRCFVVHCYVKWGGGRWYAKERKRARVECRVVYDGTASGR